MLEPWKVRFRDEYFAYLSKLLDKHIKKALIDCEIAHYIKHPYEQGREKPAKEFIENHKSLALGLLHAACDALIRASPTVATKTLPVDETQKLALYRFWQIIVDQPSLNTLFKYPYLFGLDANHFDAHIHCAVEVQD